MSEKKSRKASVQLNPIQMVWLHSQHLFQKIQQQSLTSQTQIKFYKNNNGVQIRFQGNEGNPQQLQKARQQLLKVMDSNQIRLINTSLHKDIYIRISKEARKEFPRSYIIFLHYETFENCCRKLQEKFNITSIAPELEKLRKSNPNFCFLIAEKDKIDDIQKFTNRILHSQVSCASTTFSHRRQPAPNVYKRTMSVSSLKGSFSDHNEQQYRLSIHPNPVQQQLFQMSDSIMMKLTSNQMQQIRAQRLYQGCLVSIERYEGTYSAMTKKLYYINRLQLTPNPYVQPVYAYTMQQRNPCLWSLTIITDKQYRRLIDQIQGPWLSSSKNKIETLLKIARALATLHEARQTYSGLTLNSVLLDTDRNIFLSAVIDKQIPPHTNAFVYDIRKYLQFIYRIFTGVDLSYQILLLKQQREEYFCTLSHRCKNRSVRQFLDLADRLFIRELDLRQFIREAEAIPGS